ncbi:Tetratricopeptide repeat (TPR)-like superfamily protein [Striga hermonthica]|uniref:Tetratricopeptide repeat (TPR)-like superfamily protein n=1 Tax=Striga hermonthica TaxID=68872 RepID=A0A9N7NCX6_STRHE|nr:Tetratricopeptide repeat (TPR)-like superfamily protein [Striga hermonthica]
MLLRSSSSPILNSVRHKSTAGSGLPPEPDALPQLPRTRSFCLTMSSEDGAGRSTPTRFSFDSDLGDPRRPNKCLRLPTTPRPAKIKERREHDLGSAFLTSSGLGSAAEEECLVASPEPLVVGGGVGAGGRGGMCGGGGGGGGGRGSRSGPERGPEDTDMYYEMMIQANPGNPLLLANYAKFLKEVKGDFAKAEEYCGRAILANPNDGSMLSLYADLIWKTQQDPERAKPYFHRAVKADPNDCFVVASYAFFLWATEDDEEEEEEVKTQYGTESNHTNNSPPKFFQENAHRPTLATAS